LRPRRRTGIHPGPGSWSTPKTREPRRQLSPRVAAAEPAARIAGIERVLRFVQQYRDALADWVRGIRDVVFPIGTYQLRLRSSVRCADPGT